MTNREVINFLNQVRKILLDDKSWLESTIKPMNEALDNLKQWSEMKMAMVQLPL